MNFCTLKKKKKNVIKPTELNGRKMRNLINKKIISSHETAVSLFIKENVYDKNIKTLFLSNNTKHFFFLSVNTNNFFLSNNTNAYFFLSDITKHILFFQITQSTPVFGGNIRINYATHPTGRARGNQPLN